MLINDLIEKYHIQENSKIKEKTIEYIEIIQSGDESVLWDLFTLHLGLVRKLWHQNKKKLSETDIISISYECMLPCALKYDIERGSERFAFVPFFMQRVQWKINELFFKMNPTIYIPRNPHEEGLRYYYEDESVLENVPDERYLEVDDSYPTRWDVIYEFEKNNDCSDPELQLDIKCYKLHYLNKNKIKIARRLSISRKRVEEAIENVQNLLIAYFNNE